MKLLNKVEFGVKNLFLRQQTSIFADVLRKSTIDKLDKVSTLANRGAASDLKNADKY